MAQAAPAALQRAGAARLTADKAAACVAVQPFYWEIGNATQLLAAGKAGDGGPERRTEMAIASASKWVYGAFVAERRQGQLSAEDVKFLHFHSGYTYYRVCRASQTASATGWRATCMSATAPSAARAPSAFIRGSAPTNVFTASSRASSAAASWATTRATSLRGLR